MTTPETRQKIKRHACISKTLGEVSTGRSNGPS
jgi:hypothetical protein